MKNTIFIVVLTFSLILLSCTDSNENNSPEPWACGDIIYDVDGKAYNTVPIGSDCWMAENLDASSYNDDTPIVNITEQEEWVALDSGAWSYYDNDMTIGQLHGKLYNWYAIESGKLCPNGWSIPSIDKWNQLVDTLGGPEMAGEEMKSQIGWNNSPENATNSSELSVLPSGNRDTFGGFLGLGDNVWFYTSTQDENDDTKAYWLKVSSGTDTSSGLSNKKDGLPCRCVLD